eukprot:2277927-Amphidinium_carterae.1
MQWQSHCDKMASSKTCLAKKVLKSRPQWCIFLPLVPICASLAEVAKNPSIQLSELLNQTCPKKLMSIQDQTYETCKTIKTS